MNNNKAVALARTRLLNWIDEVNAGTYEVPAKTPRFVEDFEKAVAAAARAEALEEAAEVVKDHYWDSLSGDAVLVKHVGFVVNTIRSLKGTAPPKLKLDELPGKWPGDETDEEIAEALAEVKGTAPQSPWMPIDSAPKDGTWCFVTNDPIGGRVPYSYAERAVFIEELGGWWNKSVEAADCDCLHAPTHWTPLPAPPTEEAG